VCVQTGPKVLQINLRFVNPLSSDQNPLWATIKLLFAFEQCVYEKIKSSLGLGVPGYRSVLKFSAFPSPL